eukprot:CAMPEP_0117651936 /NCGR_PEP_ID=MMETSP0804-20121206/2360_1 /TAXON_ID=1074897 /ORGANISM="Tetraselmis astigmatica, Strain CCMP880" /LENGTH=1085 /DNA_ID=CAMNT_0005457951 /DNA_START=439 /DNA_END=3694 /DNA_ORIENTATION=-
MVYVPLLDAPPAVKQQRRGDEDGEGQGDLSVPRLIKCLAERCAPGQHDLPQQQCYSSLGRAAKRAYAADPKQLLRQTRQLQKRAFSVLLKYDQVEPPHVDVMEREALNGERLSEAILTLAERNQPSSGVRLHKLSEALLERREVAVFSAAPCSRGILQAAPVPLHEHQSLLSLLLLLQDEVSKDPGCAKPGPALRGVEEVLQDWGGDCGGGPGSGPDGREAMAGPPGVAQLDLEALEGLAQGTVGERWGLPRAVQMADALPGARQRPLPEEPLPFPQPGAALLARNSSALSACGVSIHTLGSSAASSSAAPSARSSTAASTFPSLTGGGLSTTTVTISRAAARLRSEPCCPELERSSTSWLGAPQPDIPTQPLHMPPTADSDGDISMSASWRSLGETFQAAAPTSVPFSLQLSDSGPASGCTSLSGSIAGTPRSSRPPSAAGSRRPSGAVTGRPVPNPIREPSQVYLSIDDGPLAQYKTKRVSAISERAAVRLALLGMQGIEAALEQLDSGLLATPTVGAVAAGSLLAPFASTGRRCSALRAFLAAASSEAGDFQDPCTTAFCHAVDAFLSHHVAALQAVDDAAAARRKAEGSGRGLPIPVTLAELSVHTQRIHSNLHCLAVICKCEGDAPAQGAADFPRGASLISHIYALLTDAEGSTAALLRWLFSEAFKPFMDHIRAWVYTAAPVGRPWRCSGGPHIKALGHAGEHLSGALGPFPSQLPACLECVQREFLLAGAEAACCASYREAACEEPAAIAEAEGAELGAFIASQGAPPGGGPPTPQPRQGESAPFWEARGGSMPMVFGAAALRGLCTIQEHAAKERAAEAKELLAGLAERRRLLMAAEEEDALRRAEEKAQLRAAARAAKAQQAFERRIRQATLLKAQKDAVSEKEAELKALRAANIREEQELIERAVRAEHAMLLSEVAAEQAASMAEMRELERRSRLMEWRSARWQLAGARRAALLALAEAEATEMLQALGVRPALPPTQRALQPPPVDLGSAKEASPAAGRVSQRQQWAMPEATDPPSKRHLLGEEALPAGLPTDNSLQDKEERTEADDRPVAPDVVDGAPLSESQPAGAVTVVV